MSESKAKRSPDRPTVSANGRRFSDDFKRDAVRLIVEEEYTFKAAAKAVGVSEKSLRDWHKKFARRIPCMGPNGRVWRGRRRPHPCSAPHGALYPPRGERHGVILTAAQCHVWPRIAARRAGKPREASVTMTDGSGDPG